MGDRDITTNTLQRTTSKKAMSSSDKLRLCLNKDREQLRGLFRTAQDKSPCLMSARTNMQTLHGAVRYIMRTLKNHGQRVIKSQRVVPSAMHIGMCRFGNSYQSEEWEDLRHKLSSSN